MNEQGDYDVEVATILRFHGPAEKIPSLVAKFAKEVRLQFGNAEVLTAPEDLRVVLISGEDDTRTETAQDVERARAIIRRGSTDTSWAASSPPPPVETVQEIEDQIEGQQVDDVEPEGMPLVPIASRYKYDGSHEDAESGARFVRCPVCAAPLLVDQVVIDIPAGDDKLPTHLPCAMKAGLVEVAG